jgi:hypothetical protein
MNAVLGWIETLLEQRLDEKGLAWYRAASAEIGAGVSDLRFASLLSVASRSCRLGELNPSDEQRAEAGTILLGWEPERWKTLEATRVALILSRSDLAAEGVVSALEYCFAHADEGELCALYRSLAFLPDGERFAWRSGEGCRTNMLTVFEANACDTPYPSSHLDVLAWRQLVMKSLFVGAPVWRVKGLDRRLDAELARMALDLVEERRSAHRTVQPELWLCLGEHAGERGRLALEAELFDESAAPLGRAAACMGLGRSGRTDLLRSHLGRETDLLVSDTIDRVLEGRCHHSDWRHIEQLSLSPELIEERPDAIL